MANQKEDRRDALKIIGAIGSTCAFPFSADELYAQHADHASGSAAALPKPSFFSAAELETVSRLADLIIPATGTPGALAAGVPAYIDFVVSRNKASGALCKQGIEWLDAQARKKGGKRFVELGESEQVAMLGPLCAEADKAPATGPRTGGLSPRPQWRAPMQVRFFHAFKSMTADGFFTSKQGLVETLHYPGNSAMAEFPACPHEH